MNGNGAFNGHILVDKLAKLNNSQQSIETLSHWCIFHRKKARQVVETWERQFYCSPRDQRVSFLHLANDILQNSKRKGPEFVGEFWKVLPEALNDVIESGDEFGRKAVLRLVDIWEERKVFGNRPRTVKEELLGRTSENRSRNGKIIRYKLKQPAGEMLEKLISSFEHVYDARIDEDTLFSKCGTAISFLEKVEKEIGGDLGNIKGSGVVEELQGQHGILRECIEQLKLAESSRAILISQLREALQEQEFKIEHIHNQLQAAQSRYEQAGTVFLQLLPPLDQKLKEQPPPPPPPSSAFSDVVPPPPGFPPESPSTGTPVRYTQQQQQSPRPADITHSPHTSEGEHRKTAAAAVAAKLTSSTSSAQMLSYVLSSLASEGVIGQQMKEDSPSDGSKRIKVDNGSVSVPSYVPQPSSQPPLPPFPHPDSLHLLPPPSSPMAHQPPPPPPPTMPPMPPPPPPSVTGGQFMQAGPMTGVPFSYGSMPPMPGYSMVGMPPFPGPPNPYQSLQGPDSAGPFVQPPMPPPMPAIPPPMSRQ